MTTTPIPLSSAKAHPATALFKQAIAAYEAGNIDGAIDGYNSVLKMDPAHVSAWLNLGTALRKKGLFEASVAATLRALALRPDDAACYTNLGNCLIDLDRQDEALAAHKKAYEIEPNSFLIRRNYGVALRDCGKFEEALTFLDAAEELNAKKENIAWERAMCLLHMADYARGWPAFESRWKQAGMRERVSSSRENGRKASS